MDPRPPILDSAPGAAAPWFDVGDDRVRLLRDGAQALPAMLDAIQRAQREVLLEIYWVGDDAVGRRFRGALAERARSGVEVRVIYDAVGSLGIAPDWWAAVVSAGGTVHEYHAIRPFDPRFQMRNVELRDHRKLLVVDMLSGFAGGINLAELWLPPEQGGEGWRDDMIEVRGQAAQELRTLFYRTWRKLTRRRPPPDVLPFPKSGHRRVWVLASPRRTNRSIHREYLVRIGGATQRIDIANSYFLPGRRMRMALYRAAARGARVRVLVPRSSDVPIVQFAVEALFDRLMRHGIEIWLFPDTMLHAKTAIIDDEFTTIGSFNLDRRSWRKNLEANLAVEDVPFARYARSWFERDIEQAVRIEPARWRQRSLARRAVQWAAYAVRRFW